MAAPITHIILADKIFNKYFSNFSKKDFYIGTSFPDIRYTGVIKRSETHFTNISLEKIKQKDSFWAGVLFHSFIDDVIIDYMIFNNIRSLLPASNYAFHALKLISDELYYDYIKDWNEVILFMDEILPGELSFGIKENIIRDRHKMLQKYFAQKPNFESVKEMLQNTVIPDKGIQKIGDNILTIRKNKKIIKILQNFYQNFEK